MFSFHLKEGPVCSQNFQVGFCLVFCISEAGTEGVLLKNCSLNFVKFTGKHLCRSLFFNEVAGLRSAAAMKKKTRQVVFCQFCQTFKQNYFTGNLWATAFVDTLLLLQNSAQLLVVEEKAKVTAIHSTDTKALFLKFDALRARLHENQNNSNRFEISNRFEKFLRLHGNFTTAKLDMSNLFQKLFRLHGDSTTATFRTIVKLIAFN